MTKVLTRLQLGLIAIVSMALTFLGPIGLFLIADYRSIGDSLRAIEEWHLGVIAIVVLPISIAVGWRSTIYASLAVVGRFSRARPLVEGAIAGFLLTVAPLWFSALSVAWAAGTIYDGAAQWSSHEWLEFAGVTLERGSITGLIGAAYAMLIGEITLLLLRSFGIRRPSN